ncbi:hypothetical protein KH5H1_38990 [Corallococcus caeni]|nr:hypothetical protein KH5H1_38990 [Corallococcus sp. KH5-1]
MGQRALGLGGFPHAARGEALRLHQCFGAALRDSHRASGRSRMASSSGRSRVSPHPGRTRAPAAHLEPISRTPDSGPLRRTRGSL